MHFFISVPDFAPDVPEYVVKNGQVVFTNLKKPKQMNGIFQKYELEYRALDSDDTLYTVQSGHTQTFTTEVLKVRVTYQMRLAVSNRVGMSPWSQYFYPFIQEDGQCFDVISLGKAVFESYAYPFWYFLAL